MSRDKARPVLYSLDHVLDYLALCVLLLTLCCPTRHHCERMEHPKMENASHLEGSVGGGLGGCKWSRGDVVCAGGWGMRCMWGCGGGWMCDWFRVGGGWGFVPMV